MDELSEKLAIEQEKYSSLKLMLVNRNAEKRLADSLGAIEGLTVLCYHHAAVLLLETCGWTSKFLKQTGNETVPETSTSGILMEDVMHLITEDHHPESFEAYITFGCGQVQTGSFLDVAAPNGLFGLGMDNISVPSI